MGKESFSEGVTLIAKTAIKVRKEWVGNTICIVLLIISVALMIWYYASLKDNIKWLKMAILSIMGGLFSLILLFAVFFSPLGKEHTGRYKYKVSVSYDAPQASIDALYENYDIESIDRPNRVYIIKDRK